MQTQDIVTRASRGEPAAVEALLREHYDMIHAVCHRMVHNPDSANDAVQNALIAVVKGLSRFDGRSSVSTWMYRIATNAAIDEIRRTQRRPVPMDDEALTARGSSSDPTADIAEHLDDQSRVSAALAQIPEEFRAALVLRYVADMDYAEMADVLGVPIGTVRSRLSRGRHLMANLLSTPTMTGNSPTGEPRWDSPTSDPTPTGNNIHD